MFNRKFDVWISTLIQRIYMMDYGLSKLSSPFFTSSKNVSSVWQFQPVPRARVNWNPAPMKFREMKNMFENTK